MIIGSVDLYDAAKQHAQRQDDDARFQQSEKQMSETDLPRRGQKTPETADQAGSKSIDHEVRPDAEAEMLIYCPEECKESGTEE